MGDSLNFRDKILAVALSILLIMSGAPFFGIGSLGALLNASSSIFFILALFLVNKDRIILTRERLNILCVTLLLLFYLFFPYRADDRFFAASLWLVLFLTVVILDNRIIILSSIYYSNIIFIISLLALAIFILKLIGVEVPYYVYETGRTTTKEFFVVYPGTAMLNNQNYEIFGRDLFRLSGIFSEPGHYGIMCASALFMSPQILSKKKRRVIIVAGILSLSMGFFVLIIGYFLLTSSFSRRTLIVILYSFAIVALVASYLPEEFFARFIFKKVDTGGSILDARSSFEFSEFYENYNSDKLNLLGEGRLILQNNNIKSSDFRSFLLKYGYVGAALFLYWFFTLHKRRSIKMILLSFFLFIVVFAHRAWMVDYFIFMFAVYAIPITYEKSIKKLKAL